MVDNRPSEGASVCDGAKLGYGGRREEGGGEADSKVVGIHLWGGRQGGRQGGRWMRSPILGVVLVV